MMASQPITLSNIHSMGEMLERIDRVRNGDEELFPVIAGMQSGDCFVRVMPEFGFIVYGELTEAPAACQLEIHQRWSFQYSAVAPQGEQGPVQLAAITAKISRVCFEACKAAGWPTSFAAFARLYETQLSVN